MKRAADRDPILNRLLSRYTRPIAPGAFARAGRAVGSSEVVVCAGDSITHGVMSANYVTILQAERIDPARTFVNAGISGDLAWNLAQRLDRVIACRPDFVTVLIGTNDAAAQLSQSWAADYVKQQRLPRPPTLEWYREQLSSIIERLLAETDAQLALLTVPPIGEDLDSSANAIVDAVNDIIRAVGAAARVPVLPLHDRLVAALPARPAPRFDGTKRLMLRGVAARFLLRRSFDQIADRHGRALLTDDIHFSDRAARITADLLAEYLAVAGLRS